MRLGWNFCGLQRYGVACGLSERGDRSDLQRFRLWMAEARWRIRKMRATERLRRAVQLQQAWGVETSVLVM